MRSLIPTSDGFDPKPAVITVECGDCETRLKVRVHEGYALGACSYCFAEIEVEVEQTNADGTTEYAVGGGTVVKAVAVLDLSPVVKGRRHEPSL